MRAQLIGRKIAMPIAILLTLLAGSEKWTREQRFSERSRSKDGFGARFHACSIH